MIQTSEAFQELMQSSVRPKCEPEIKLTGKDALGQDIEIVWTASDITNLTYKRGIDPVGRILPYMELEWQEVYSGEFTRQQFPLKYDNVVSYMKVELSFYQDLDFYNTWKILKNYKWSELKTKTWKEIKEIAFTEKVTMPIMFLTARPTVDGQTITWSAKDCLSFLTEQCFILNGEAITIGQAYNDYSDAIYKVILSYIILNARSPFLNSIDIFKSITQSVTDIESNENVLDCPIFKAFLVDGATNEAVLNLANLHNLCVNFSGDIFKFYDAYKMINSESVFEFSDDIISDYPKTTYNMDITNYDYFYHKINCDTSNVKVAHKQLYSDQRFPIYIYYFDEIGIPEHSGESTVYNTNGKYVITCISSSDETINYCPVKFVEYEDNVVVNNKQGETFTEKNPLNLYDKNSAFIAGGEITWGSEEDPQTKTIIGRLPFLKEYFNKNISSLEFDGLANVSLEVGDTIDVPTNYFDDEGEREIKHAVIVETEITYNGAIYEKFICHERSASYDNQR